MRRPWIVLGMMAVVLVGIILARGVEPPEPEPLWTCDERKALLWEKVIREGSYITARAGSRVQPGASPNRVTPTTRLPP